MIDLHNQEILQSISSHGARDLVTHFNLTIQQLTNFNNNGILSIISNPSARGLAKRFQFENIQVFVDFVEALLGQSTINMQQLQIGEELVTEEVQQFIDNIYQFVYHFNLNRNQLITLNDQNGLLESISKPDALALAKGMNFGIDSMRELHNENLLSTFSDFAVQSLLRMFNLNLGEILTLKNQGILSSIANTEAISLAHEFQFQNVQQLVDLHNQGVLDFISSGLGLEVLKLIQKQNNLNNDEMFDIMMSMKNEQQQVLFKKLEEIQFKNAQNAKKFLIQNIVSFALSKQQQIQ